MKTTALSWLCALGLFMAAQPAAAIIINVDRATFQASIGQPGITLQDFDSFAPTSVLVSDGDVSYIPSIGGAGFVTDEFATTTPFNSLGSISTFSAIAGSAGEQLALTFTNPITAFAIDIITSATGDGAYEAAVGPDDVDSVEQIFPGGLTGQFIGFTSDTPFSTVTINAISFVDFTVDTLVFGQASALGGGGGPTPVSEPGVLLLLSGGLLGMAWVQRRRRQRSTPA